MAHFMVDRCGYLPEVRVTINETLDLFLDEVVASGLYPSKAELMRCGVVHLLKDFNLIQNIFNTNKKESNTKHAISMPKDKR